MSCLIDAGVLLYIYFEPNQLERPFFASLAFCSTVLSKLFAAMLTSFAALSLYSLALASASANLALASAVYNHVSISEDINLCSNGSYGCVDLVAGFVYPSFTSLLGLFE